MEFGSLGGKGRSGFKKRIKALRLAQDAYL